MPQHVFNTQISQYRYVTYYPPPLALPASQGQIMLPTGILIFCFKERALSEPLHAATKTKRIDFLNMDGLTVPCSPKDLNGFDLLKVHPLETKGLYSRSLKSYTLHINQKKGINHQLCACFGDASRKSTTPK